METIYLCIVIFLLCLAVFDLFVGVSNDAVNFLQSAVGARVATFRTVLIIASVAVVLGAVLSSGMMDIARHGIMMPAKYSFHEVMTVFLAVMVTDVIILDVFNSLGMPTSTTVSLVFELLGGAFMISTLKIMGDPSLDYGVLLNSDKALSVIIAIFVSVAISFVVGMVVMWISPVRACATISTATSTCCFSIHSLVPPSSWKCSICATSTSSSSWCSWVPSVLPWPLPATTL